MLVELLAVLVILAILLAVVLPVLRSLGPWQLKTSAYELAARIREARQTAVASGIGCRVVFYTPGRRYRVVLPDGSEFIDLPEGISYAANNFPLDNGRPTVSFRYTGAPNRGGHVGLKDQNGRRMYVIVTPVTGRVRVDTSPP
jgi:Tfp pilus assembly protein FimT